MGFTAIWISPVHKNYDGPRTAYGDAYHGYWVTDIGQLNDRFGTAQDLKDLSAEVHRRGMLFMVDVVVNHVAVTTTSVTDYSPYYFKKAVCVTSPSISADDVQQSHLFLVAISPLLPYQLWRYSL
jgi:alpha-amylase